MQSKIKKQPKQYNIDWSITFLILIINLLGLSLRIYAAFSQTIWLDEQFS